MVYNVLDKQKFQSKVSTVLNKDATQFGRLLMFDGKEETCWCSDKDSPQWVKLQWEKAISISQFQIQFQGGFVGQECEVIIALEGEEKVVEPFYPEDINSIQTFSLSVPRITKQISLNFISSSDFFGRIIIYKLGVLSQENVES